jgi:hypothetical protein
MGDQARENDARRGGGGECIELSTGNSDGATKKKRKRKIMSIVLDVSITSSRPLDLARQTPECLGKN